MGRPAPARRDAAPERAARRRPLDERHHADDRLAGARATRTAPVLPGDPVQRFLALLIEDYADEWLWRPAMHYRWSHVADAHLAGTRLAQEIVVLPLPLARAPLDRLAPSTAPVRPRRRDHELDTPPCRGLGLAAARSASSRCSGARPFILGDRPTIADIGLMGPLWRHFVHDPTPARLMQETAPAVYEWAARMWNARAGEIGEREPGAGHARRPAPAARGDRRRHTWRRLSANALAHRAGAPRAQLDVQADELSTGCRPAPTASGAWSS